MLGILAGLIVAATPMAVAAAAAETPATPAAPAAATAPAAPAAKTPAATTSLPGHSTKSGKLTARFGGIEIDVPASWIPVPPANSLRAGEFQAPVAGQEPAEFVVFYFAPGRGGSQADNIGRWASQFSDGKGAPVQPTVNQGFVNNMAVTRVELNGSYSRGASMGPDQSALKANQTLLAAIITTPVQGNVTLHFFGSQEAVKKHRKAFEAAVKSIRFKG
jgi:hypothetical protein